MIERLIKSLIVFISKNFFIKQVFGIENLPKKGPYIIVPNHSSYFDHFFIFTVVNYYMKQQVLFLTKKEAFDTYLSRKWHMSMGTIPLNRDATDITAFKAVVSKLKEGEIICIYPEGTRSPTGKIYQGKQGAIRMALAADVTIVPVGIEGAFDILPRKKLLPSLRKAKIQIGEPILLERNRDKNKLDIYMKRVMNSIKSLSNDEDRFIRDLPSEESLLVEEMLRVAYEWNERGIRAYPKDSLSPNLLHKRVIYICDQVLKVRPNHPIALFEKSRAIGRIGLNSKMAPKKIFLLMKGRKILERSIIENPTHASNYYALAVWYMEMPQFIGGSHEKALELYEKANELGKEVYIMMGYAKALLNNGRPEQAKIALLELVSELPTKTLVDARRKVEAIAMVMRIDPEFQIEEKVINKCFLNYQNG
ncbi:1-acyl-sn-glycerol-3-phosphate acyltransferase [Oceanobacillus kimchii]|uniref:1-acyl-sn-glycerol-3-phosphate acyltransferase n=1 Tax=Oceanobacillus kimchii TaxID=746691 RepID=UPI000346AB8E|nr:1-acyl-sn-glycerol-3-phosphate acyltransferase [Oceanobacillus kimchii]MCT1578441.1 1-acyl-sn-glycerol-3-phosphate acyltransferase [Oceanobacillus kimchii]MCT2136510.1 1-acyl-sn-glycerol-3-phosphate acyltransferase [Oceanobacillus kimchii]